MRTVIHLYFDFMKLILRARWFCRGGEHVEDLRTPFILASNHTGHADTHCILRAAAGRRQADRGGGSLRLLRTTKQVSIKRSLIQFCRRGLERRIRPTRPVHPIGEDLGPPASQQLVLLMYPEGTRSRSGRMAGFKPGVSVISRLSRCPVVPTCVIGGGKPSPGGMVPRHAVVEVRFGEPMYARKGQSHEEFTAEVEQAVRDLLQERRPAPEVEQLPARPTPGA